jgi:uncharacterized protein
MIHRLFKPLISQSFFVFGPRGSGKSTYLKHQFIADFHGQSTHQINLLDYQFLDRYATSPQLLNSDLLALKEKPDWIIIDEIQKVPALLDQIHMMIEDHQFKFILTGSSARKLKRGSANLLAGRAYDYKFHPLTFFEIEKLLTLNEILNWGSLPKIFSLDEPSRKEYLRSYAQTYLKEEILEELLVRNGAAFRNFLKIAGLENGNSLSFNKLSKDLNLDRKTVESYFQILQDTLVGFFLPAFHRSTRKSIKQQPKFYIFDLGVKKALTDELDSVYVPRTPAYGKAFEHFLICEIFRLNTYFRSDFDLHHYQTTAGGEIDLVLTKGRKTIAIEIKSTEKIDLTEIHKLQKTSHDISADEVYYISNDSISSQHGNVSCLHWQTFLKKLFNNSKD